MVRVQKDRSGGVLASAAAIFASSSSTAARRRRRPVPRRGDAKDDVCALCAGAAAVAAVLMVAVWGFASFVATRPSVHPAKGAEVEPHRTRLRSNDVKEAAHSQHSRHGKATTPKTKPGASQHHNHNQHRKMHGDAPPNDGQTPRVIGVYAYPVHDLDDYSWSRRQAVLPYVYETERIDPYLLSHTSTTLRRMRSHSYFDPEQTTLSDVVQNYNLAIAGSHVYVKSEDPLRHLMLSSDSRERQRSIVNDSEDYEDSLAEPLEDEECEAAPQHERWMLHSFPTCNFVHEFDFALNMRKDKTKLLGNGYWRDVWPVVDTRPQIKRQYKQTKVALKTIRYEHDYTERNFHRHERDAIVAERLTASPRVTDIHAFCGNSGYFEFASGGSLADRLEESYMAQMDVEDEAGRRKPEENEHLLSPRDKLRTAHEISLALADFHDVETLKDGKGKVTSAAIVHADITSDQFIHVDDGDGVGVYKLNDFNRCRFMRRYKGSNQSGGDGEPCGFYVMNNPAKNRSPEEYAYTVETGAIDIYSLGNVFFEILTLHNAWEDWDEDEAQHAVMDGERPDIPEEVLKSKDPVDVVMLKVMRMCWEHKPENRPRAREVAVILGKELKALDEANAKKVKKKPKRGN